MQLYGVWRDIVETLEAEMSGVAAVLPKLDIGASRVALKAFEDTLDAIVCAWVAICALQGRAKAFGDKESAIWVPTPAKCPHLGTACDKRRG